MSEYVERIQGHFDCYLSELVGTHVTVREESGYTIVGVLEHEDPNVAGSILVRHFNDAIIKAEHYSVIKVAQEIQLNTCIHCGLKPLLQKPAHLPGWFRVESMCGASGPCQRTSHEASAAWDRMQE